MKDDSSNSPNTSLDVLEHHFGCAIGPDEIEAMRDATPRELSLFVELCDELYNRQNPATSGPRPGEHRAFPSAFAYRDVCGFCYKDIHLKEDDNAAYWVYLKHLELPGEILKFLLYYDTVVIPDPISAVFLCDHTMGKEPTNEIRERLANAMELLVPIGPFIKNQSIILYPVWRGLSCLGTTSAADQDDVTDDEFLKICTEYGIRTEKSKPLIVSGGILEWQRISAALKEAGVSETESHFYATMTNGYMYFASALNAYFVAQNSLMWDIVRYKTRKAHRSFPAHTAEASIAALNSIELTDFDRISSDELIALRQNEEAFAAWRADVSTLVAISATDVALQDVVARFQELSRDILPRRAAEIRALSKKSSLSQHFSDAGFGFAAATLAGVQTGDVRSTLRSAASGSAAALLLSILFRRPPKEQQRLGTLYSMLAKRSSKSGAVALR